MPSLVIDGAHGEGGGQLLRTAVALAAIAGTPVVVRNIRANRPRPGLAAQHLAAIGAVGDLCAARIEGLALGAREIRFAPRGIRGGEHRVDIGTAGSITLLLQALLPVMVSAREPSAVTVTGGTDVRGAPPLDYFREVLLWQLARMGLQAQLTVMRRGYFPRGGGAVRFAVQPVRLQPLHAQSPATNCAVRGLAHVAQLDPQIAARMARAAARPLARLGVQPQIEAVALDPDLAAGPGGAVVVWARGSAVVLGAGQVAQRGVRAESLGQAVGEELAADLADGASVDVHAADQLLVYQALAGGGSFLTRQLTSHANTAIWLIGRFLPVRFATSTAGRLTRVSVVTA